VSILTDLRSALDPITRPPLAAAAAALFLVLLLGIVAGHLVRLEPPSGGRIDAGTGDFLAFWTGAVAIHDGHGRSLYDFDEQRRIQERALGGASPEFQGYLNPPLLAVMLSPTVPLGYVRAFYVYDAFCVICLAVALAATLRLVPSVRAVKGGAATLACVVASYEPMLETTFGGQNTPMTFALSALLALALARRSTLGAGVALGLLSYKPQYALGLGAALLIAGEWRVLAGAGVVAFAHYVLGALYCGVSWPLDMLAFERRYRPLEMAANAHTHFSWPAVAGLLMPSPVGELAAAAGAIVVVVIWWRARGLVRTAPGPWFALAFSGAMLASPHEQYYDVALLVLPAAVLVDATLAARHSVPLAMRLALAAAYVGYPAWELAGPGLIQPLFFVLVAIFAWAIVRARQAVAA